MSSPIHHPGETASNPVRDAIATNEPRALRTFTPTQAVLARSEGIFHWTPEGRRLYDFTSGVLVSNLGHNPPSWMERWFDYMGWKRAEGKLDLHQAVPMTAYNALTPIESEAVRRLTAFVRERPGGRRFEQVMWAASGSEAIQKALWAALARDRTRDMILATRFGFHGKKGLAGAVTGCETDHDRDPRVRFVSFPREECADVSQRGRSFDPTPYRKELEALYYQFGPRLTALITEPYLGGGGSYHPPKEYLQLLQQFCRQHDLVFILDEVQANFGRTGEMFAFETYGIEPDIVVLGKGLGNGVPVSAALGRRDLFTSLDYGEGSDTWSANPLSCAAVLATLDAFKERDVLAGCRRSSAVIEEGLVSLKKYPFVARVRGEKGGMVWGVEMQDHGDRLAADWANVLVMATYRGEPGRPEGDGIHLLGPLAKKVIRIAPPLVITEAEASEAMALMHRVAGGLMSAPKTDGVLMGAGRS
jgi:4-aminobutyrate aminotransferase-like enzyme